MSYDYENASQYKTSLLYRRLSTIYQQPVINRSREKCDENFIYNHCIKKNSSFFDKQEVNVIRVQDAFNNSVYWNEALYKISTACDLQKLKILF